MRRRGVAVPGALLLLAACSRPPSADQTPTAQATRGRIERLVVATGTIEPEEEVEVRPRISGIVERVHAAAGDVVERDQLLIDIERELLEAQAREAQARLDGARVEERYATTDLERATRLRGQGTLSEHDYDEARSRHERATAAIARDQATLESLTVQLRYASVRAPIAGKVLDVYAKVGSAVSSVAAVNGGTPLLALAAAGPLHLKGLVDENEIAWVQVGQDARIRTEAFGNRVFAGRVTEIKPLGQRQQNVTYFELEIEVTDPEAARLRPRMSADADIVTEVVEDAILVPETALVFEGNEVYVERPAGGAGQVERRPVRTGILEGGRAQVLEGLAAGDDVRLR